MRKGAGLGLNTLAAAVGETESVKPDPPLPSAVPPQQPITEIAKDNVKVEPSTVVAE